MEIGIVYDDLQHVFFRPGRPWASGGEKRVLSQKPDRCFLEHASESGLKRKEKVGHESPKPRYCISVSPGSQKSNVSLRMSPSSVPILKRPSRRRRRRRRGKKNDLPDSRFRPVKVKKVAWDNGCRRSLVTVQASQCCGGSAVRTSDWLGAHAEPASRGRWWQPSNNRRRRAPNRKKSTTPAHTSLPRLATWSGWIPVRRIPTSASSFCVF